MNWEPVSREMARRFGWINTSISGSRQSNCRSAARHMKAMKACSQSTSAREEASGGNQAVGRSSGLPAHVRSRAFAKNGTGGPLGAQRRVQTGLAMGDDLGGADQRREAATHSKARAQWRYIAFRRFMTRVRSLTRVR